MMLYDDASDCQMLTG